MLLRSTGELKHMSRALGNDEQATHTVIAGQISSSKTRVGTVPVSDTLRAPELPVRCRYLMGVKNLQTR
jgi:hypothetical protein